MKAIGEKCQVTYNGKLIIIKSDLSAETIKAKIAFPDVFQPLKANNCQERLLYPGKLLFKIDGEINPF
jgi:hypothetical protein